MSPAARADLDAEITRAYNRTGSAWSAGPARVYDRLARVLVDHSPAPLAGRTVLDIGAGAGAASRAIAKAGGRPLPVDAALGMLRPRTSWSSSPS